MKRVKKFISVLLLGIICCSTISNVYAKILTINEISNKFNVSTLIDSLNQLGENISSSVDMNNKTLNIYSDSEKIFSFSYTDEYIEYDNRSAIVTKENAEKEIITALALYGVIDSIFELSGYKDKTLSDPENDIYNNTYDTYGVQIETEKYSFSGNETDGSSWSLSGDFIKYFKMSFDTDKISALVEKYGVDASIKKPDMGIVTGLTPTLEARDIKENSVTLYPHIDFNRTSPNQTVFCHIYRSTSKDGDYERITDLPTNCLDDMGFIDSDLNSNTTYYYKTIEMNGTNYSDVISVTTKGITNLSNPVNNASDTDDDGLVENPQTGLNIPVGLITILGISGLGIYYYAKKRDRFI